MAFINNKRNSEILYAVICRSTLLQALFDSDRQLLDSCYDNLLILVFQLIYEVADIICLIDIHNIVVCIGLERLRCLHIKVFSVNEEDSFLNARNVDQQISCSFVARHCFAGAGSMPDVAGFSLT